MNNQDQVTKKIERYGIKEHRFKICMALSKWKLLGVRELKEDSEYNGGMTGFRTMIQRMENDGLLKSYVDDRTKRKFLYLPKWFYKQVYNRDINDSGSISWHDARCVILLRLFKKLKSVDDAILRSNLFDSNNESHNDSFEEDGLVTIKSGEDLIYWAIEVELTRKGQERIYKKFDQYFKSDTIDLVVFVFESIPHFKAYKNYLETYLDANNLDVEDCKIGLLYYPNMLMGLTSMKDLKVWIFGGFQYLTRLMPQ